MPFPAVKKLRIPPLAPVCFLGLFLITAVFSALVFFSFYPVRNSAETRQAGDSFYRGLQNYDALFARAHPSDNPALFTRALDRLEKNGMGVESWLSLLKRRRALARLDPRFLNAYREKALEAVKAFPHSEALAAVAVDALSTGGAELFNEGETVERLRDLSSQVSDPQFSLLVLSARILSGDLQDPARAATVPDLDKVLSSVLSLPGKIVPVNTEALHIDAAILSILKKDISGAAARINTILPSPVSMASPDLAHFAGEFFYDYGNPLRAAELFALAQSESSLARTADALLLGGLGDGARAIWAILASPPEGWRASPPPPIRNRSLYNLAATSTDDPRETRTRLEELFAVADSGEQPWYDDPAAAEDVYIYSLIRYTRLLDTSRALAMLETGQLEKHPLLDLEQLRRLQEQVPLNQGTAETWMLLNRHNGDQRLYEWAAWYFDYQRQYKELALLIRAAEREAGQGQSFGPWLELHRGLTLMRESRLEEALGQLRPLSDDPDAAALWQIPANMGRIMEAHRSPATALEYYGLAFSRLPDRDQMAASNIQFRISRCLKALGRERESRQALEYALDLNPDNLNAKLDLGWLDSRQIF